MWTVPMTKRAREKYNAFFWKWHTLPIFAKRNKELEEYSKIEEMRTRPQPLRDLNE